MGGCQQGNGGRHEMNNDRPPQWLKQFQIEMPQLLCPHSFTVTNICISGTCGAVALFCQNPSCPSCHKIHNKCGSIKLQTITESLQWRANVQRQFLLKMEEAQIKAFNSIQARRMKLYEDFFLGGFDDTYVDVVKSVFLGVKSISMNGKLAQQFFERLKHSNNGLLKTEHDIMRFYKRQIERITAPAVALENELLTKYLEKGQVMTLNKENEIHEIHLKMAEEGFQSSIISINDADKLHFINDSLEYPKKMRRIFRASTHMFKAQKFHELCDNIPHTLILVQTQFGKILGGYTPLTWNMSKGFAQDFENEGFLMSVSLLQKYTLIKPDKAIQCNPEYGPVFGSGADLAISDQCDKNRDSCVNFPFAYNYKNPYKFNQDAWTALCGAVEGKNFRVRQYEVFEIIW